MLAAVLAFLALAAAWAIRAGDTGFAIACAVWFVFVALTPAWPRFGPRMRAWSLSAFLAFLALAAAGALRDSEPEFAAIFVLLFAFSTAGAWVAHRRRVLAAHDTARFQSAGGLLITVMAVAALTAAGAMWIGEKEVALVAVAMLVAWSFSLYPLRAP